MADTRLPDVVPAKDLASGKESEEPLLSGSEVQLAAAAAGHQHNCDSEVERCAAAMPDWHITILSSTNNEDNPSDTPIVHIWSSSDSNESNSSLVKLAPEEVCCSSRLEQIEHRSDSQLGSDSGIDSQLTSPTVIDGYNKLQEQSAFVLDLSANHLSVPSRMKLGSLRSSQEKHSSQQQQQQQPEKLNEDEPAIVENSVHGTGEQRNDPSPPNNTISTSSRFLPQKRHHRNFLPVDYSLDGWQSPRSDNFLKIRSLPSECEHQTETMEETNSLAVSWSDSSSTPITTNRKQPTSSSPKICVHVSSQPIDRSFEGQSSIISERSCSYDSQESSHFLADQETDPRCYSPSRKPSFGSICSDSCTENMDSRTSIKPVRSSHHNSGMLSRSSSSRSTFLSVPTRVPNHLWLSSTSDHQNDHNKVIERQSSVNSQLGSTSSLMASHFSLSNPYLRLCLNEGGINDALLLSLAGDETNHHAVLHMFDDPYYDSAAAAAIQLSLTQRLAFPQLVENDPESDKQNSRHQQRNELPREEGSLNFFAKIITFLVLVFVIVLVVGVLVKISHTPR